MRGGRRAGREGQQASASGRNWGSVWRFAEGFSDGSRERVSEMAQVKRELGHGIVHFKMATLGGHLAGSVCVERVTLALGVVSWNLL